VTTIPILRLTCCLILAGLLAACASKPHRAPVESRTVPSTRQAQPAPTAAAPAINAATAAAAAEPAKPPPGIENAGKPGYYTVKPGDTLIRIGLDNGQNWRDIARWNGIDNANLIEVGQVVRVVPPAPVANAQPVAPAARVESRPLDARTDAAPAATNAVTNAAPAAAGAASAAPPVSSAPPLAQAPAAAAPRDPDEDITWAWPAAGPVVAPFDEAKNKGLAIAGQAGDPVYAAADGRVVYAGSGLRGYGNLVIVKHNNTFLSAYAHNQTLLVKEDQAVRRGQEIAKMGSSDADRVQLHFEIRRQGKPVDPARLLPPR